jgi:hypothetical protein
MHPSRRRSDDESSSMRAPDHCAQCGAFGSVRLESTLRGESVWFAWSCELCGWERSLDRLDPGGAPTLR